MAAPDGDGNVFSINTDGSGLQNLLSFSGTGGAYPGFFPSGSLTLSGSTLYGTTSEGGANGNGSIFSINTDGSGYQNLVSFTGTGGAIVALPIGSLTLSGSTVYGMTANGGVNGSGMEYGYGTIFSVNTDGSGFRNLLSFSGTGGENPAGGLTLSGSILYGMTVYGGASNGGTIFTLATNGSGFHNLLSFSGTGGENPAGSLTLSGSTLYGMTGGGGTSYHGNIFSISTTGGSLQTLLSFSGPDGYAPVGDLTLSGSTMYGMTFAGGPDGDGSIFSINLDGSGFQNPFSFNGVNGALPYGDLTLSGSTLYGMTAYGGDNGDGVVFSLTIPEPSSVAMLAAAAIGLLGYVWRRRATA